MKLYVDVYDFRDGTLVCQHIEQIGRPTPAGIARQVIINTCRGGLLSPSMFAQKEKAVQIRWNLTTDDGRAAPWSVDQNGERPAMVEAQVRELLKKFYWSRIKRYQETGLENVLYLDGSLCRR